MAVTTGLLKEGLKMVSIFCIMALACFNSLFTKLLSLDASIFYNLSVSQNLQFCFHKCHKEKINCTSFLSSMTEVFSCDICGNAFTSFETLTNDRRLRHLKTKVFPCYICENAFINFETLTNHRRLKHLMTEVFLVKSVITHSR